MNCHSCAYSRMEARIILDDKMKRLTIFGKPMLAHWIRPVGRAFGQNIEEAEKPPPPFCSVLFNQAFSHSANRRNRQSVSAKNIAFSPNF